MAAQRSVGAAVANSQSNTQQLAGLRRLYGSMKRYRGLALSIAPQVVMALVAILLILVVLPAALTAQAAAIR
jgi:hypothetical protein